ncbi:MAG: 16S rRNA (guanine(966)-N(2))-methyltransferase RsmD [Magnetococcales bacterium]|nr:16S rRNA (guanine(966)-N(2))-methyltransferase RsmD [Magnetococcales bacterium]
MMRVSGGSARGRVLRSPPGEDIRPTSQRIRESLFAILGEGVVGSRVLDLFAGSGALGLEALSRGAQRAIFVDILPSALALVRENLGRCALEGSAEVFQGSATEKVTYDRLVAKSPGDLPFDLVFLDPPYRQGKIPVALSLLAGSALLGPEAMVVAEHEGNGWNAAAVGGRWRVVTERRYGDSQVTFLRWRGRGFGGGVSGELTQSPPVVAGC